MTVLLIFSGLAPLINYRFDASVETNATQLRNLIIAGDGTVPVVVTENFTADGTTIYWPLSYVPDTSKTPPTMTAAGTTRSLATAGTSSPSAAFGILTLAPGMVALSIGTDGVPANTTVLSITYTYAAPISVQLQNAASIALAAALPSWGYQGYQPLNAGATFAAATADGQGQLSLWAVAKTIVKTTITEESATQGLSKGQQIEWVSGRFGLDLTMVITQLVIHGSQSSGTAGGGKLIDLTLQV